VFLLCIFEKICVFVLVFEKNVIPLQVKTKPPKRVDCHL